MTVTEIELRIGDILGLHASYLADPLPVDNASEHLEELFVILREAERSDERAQAEELIWALWCSHEDHEAARALQKATGALNRHEFAAAQVLLDELVEAQPGWAEAWNKRATLLFMNERDTASLEDIARTLALEPRHFGALSGLGQLCLRNGDDAAALAAFQFALAINPNLTEIKSAAEALRRRLSPVFH